MIEKERLQELIEQGATIYSKFDGEFYDMEIDLSTNHFYVEDDMLFSSNTCYCGGEENWFIEDLYENKEQAVFYREYNTLRTEYFKPLYYDDIDQNYCYDYRFHCKNCHEYLIRVSGKDIILFWLNCNHKEYFKNTKEEYQKVIDRCLKLFLGEKK